MTVPPGYHAISNMPVERNATQSNGWNYFEFYTSVKMSSYLVAFVTSDFEKISAQTDNNILVSVYTVPGRTELGEYALKIALPALKFYQDSFGIDYPLPKLDMIAIPDFASG
jgi:aminopeptidase N